MKPRPVLQVQTLKIERMAPEGQAIGRAPGGGKVVFVPYGVPGDELDAETVSSKGGYSVGRLLALRTPGPQRIDPPCPLHFYVGRQDPWCGGCDWQQMDTPAQLEHKRALVLDCLKRIGGLPTVEVGPCLPSPKAWRYRNKVQVPFGLQDGRIVAGFYSPGSHRIVDFQDCPVQPELSVRLTLRLKDWAREKRWRVYDERLHRGWLRHALIRVNRHGQGQLTLVTRSAEFPGQEEFVAAMRRAFPELVGLFQNVQEEKTSVILGSRWRKLWGSPHLEERIGRLRLLCSPGAFLQVNTPACELLYEQAERALTAGGFHPGFLADLYCGVGSIALWLSPSADKVLGLEENREAVADAWANARANHVSNARFIAGRAETLLRQLREEWERRPPGSCAVVLDPPRSGVAKPILASLQAPAVGRIVYVSCNPATFARDAALLSQTGFGLKQVQPVDLFPQTSHVELVGAFERVGL